MGFSIGIYSNTNLLKDIHKSYWITNIHFNAGVVHITHMGTLHRYMLVLFNKYGITNILSMANATKKYPVSYDSEAGYRLILQKYDEQSILNRIPSGLYFYDAGNCDILMVATTMGNREGYANCKF